MDQSNPDLWDDVDLGNGLVGHVYNGPGVPRDFIDKVCSVDSVTQYDMDKRVLVYLGNYVIYPGLNHGFIEKNTVLPFEKLEYTVIQSQTVSLNANGNTGTNRHFRTGQIELVEGWHIDADETSKVLVSDYFANKNNLPFGEKITFEIREGLVKVGDDVEKT